MDYFLYAFFIISVIGMRIMPEGNREYISRGHTQCVNGVFVMMVFLSHFKQYITCGPRDELAFSFLKCVGQGMVTTFLFYSGYGIMLSICTKENYVSSLPKRFFHIWRRFACAIVMYLVMDYLLEMHYDWKTILWSFTGYLSVGNSNWYMFAIFFLYLVTFVAAVASGENRSWTLVLITVCCIGYIYILNKLGTGYWYYDTILCYPAGMAFCLMHRRIEESLQYNLVKTFMITACLTIAFGLCYRLDLGTSGYIQIVLKESKNILFVLVIVLITMHVKVGNRILSWFGANIFEVYILERIPMIVWQDAFGKNVPLYFCLCLGATILLAISFKAGEKAFLLGRDC